MKFAAALAVISLLLSCPQAGLFLPFSSAARIVSVSLRASINWRIDEETQALVDGLVDRLPGTRLLILATYRPEYQHPWGGHHAPPPKFGELRSYHAHHDIGG